MNREPNNQDARNSTMHLLSDTELANAFQAAREEMRRRSSLCKWANGGDAGVIIKGQEMAKRATLIAAAGGYSLLYAGPPGCGKTMLRALAAALGHTETFEACPCRCGYRADPRRACLCTSKDVEAYQRQWPKAEMYVDVPPVPAAVLESSLTGTSEAAIKARIDGMPTGSYGLSGDAASLLRGLVADTGLSARQYDTVLQVADTIARVECAGVVRACHVMEAANYRYPV